MPLSPNVPTFTLVGEFPPLSPDGAERQGSFTFTPVPPVIADASGVYLGVENATLNASGGFSKTLAGCDAFGTPFVWRMDGDITGLPPFSVNLTIPGSAGTVHLGTVMEAGVTTLPANYTVVIGPRGATGPSGGGSGGGTPADTVAAGTSFGASSTPGSVGTYSRGDHAHGTPTAPTKTTIGLANVDNTSDASKPVSSAVQTALASEVTRANAAYDAAGSAAAALVSAKAYTDAHPGGTGGVSIRTASVRITDDDLSGLPVAASWVVAVTKPGTPLKCSIAATAGDRIRVCGNFMRAGSHFLDWVLLDSAGAISLYASTGTGTAPTEGSPVLYPSLSFSYATGDELFTVASGHLNAGVATVALAHQGTGSGVVYAHTTYPWRLRLENIGPEPS